MLLFLDTPITTFELLIVVTFLLAIFSFFIWYNNARPVWRESFAEAQQTATTGYAWARKSAPYVLLLVFLVLYPFTQPFIHFVTNLFYGVPDGAAAVDSLGNATGAAIAADQVAGGGVQLGTFFTKLWITIVFYVLFSSLPWLLQQLTHPAPTAWAKTQYKDDFASLSAPDKFTAYGRLQFINTAQIVGAALAAALLV